MSPKADYSLLRQVQLVQLEILLEVDRICRKHEIRYQLFASTLLGAVRHKGFIPWDDDIDVAMETNEYEKFLEVCKSSLDNKFFLQNNNTDPNFFRQYSKIRMNNTKYVEHTFKDIDMHQGIFIDIFPMDKVKPGSIIENIRCGGLYILWIINNIRNVGVSSDANLFKKIIGGVVKLTNKFIKKSTFDKFERRILTSFNNRRTGYFNHLTNKVTKDRFKKYLIKENYLKETMLGEFEGNKFPIPKNYDEILSNLFGEYMRLPPEEERKPHHNIIELSTNKEEE